jgi:excisionase family DNA binding protein
MDGQPEVMAGLWTIRLAAAKLGTTPRAMYRLTARGQIPFVRFGRRILIDPVVLGRWIEENSVPSGQRRRP